MDLPPASTDTHLSEVSASMPSPGRCGGVICTSRNQKPEQKRAVAMLHPSLKKKQTTDCPLFLGLSLFFLVFLGFRCFFLLLFFLGLGLVLHLLTVEPAEELLHLGVFDLDFL